LLRTLVEEIAQVRQGAIDAAADRVRARLHGKLANMLGN